jgi:hypothetical protein
MIPSQKVVEYATQLIVVCSFLHSALPPQSTFDDYPRIQKAYKVFVVLVGFVAVNWRGSVDKVNASTTTKGTE